MMKFREWIDINKINWSLLSLNPCPYALELLKKEPHKIDLYWLSKNNSLEAIEYLEQLNVHNYKINWNYLSTNMNAFNILEKNPNKINWYFLTLNANDKAIQLLKENPNKIIWNLLSLNTNIKAIELLEENPDKINWNYLSQNKNSTALTILKKNPNKINWNFLSLNENPEAITLLKENPSKINWENLCLNKSAIELLELNKNHINDNKYTDEYYSNLSQNPSIFTYDYEAIKNKNQILNEEIIIKALHPKRMLKLMETYGEDVIYDCYFND